MYNSGMASKSQQVLEDLLDPGTADRLWDKFCWKARFKLNNQPEPDWNKLIEQSELPPRQARLFVAGLKRLGTSPFFYDTGAHALHEFCFKKLPRIEAKRAGKDDRQGKRLCALFRFLMVMVLQARAIYPRNPVEVGTQLQRTVKDRTGRRLGFRILSELLTDKGDRAPCVGRNTLIAHDQDRLLAYEKTAKDFRPFERPPQVLPKSAEYRRELLEDRRFHADWKLITDNFQRELDHYEKHYGVILPTWHRRIEPAPTGRKAEFSLVFDFFCWKWFMHGIIWSRVKKSGYPLTEEPHFKLTPVGTEIFIPGYWSLDKTRDGLWDYVVDLHKARGVRRGGTKSADNRKRREAQLKRLLRAEQEARKKGLEGTKRLDYLKREAGYALETDPAQMYRLLRKAKQMFPASHAQP